MTVKEREEGHSIPERSVMALEMARAAQTPCPLPDMSSPSMSFANRSFIVSISILRKIKKSERTERRDAHDTQYPQFTFSLRPH